MKAVSIKNLVKKLSNLGLESLGNLYTKNNIPKTEQIGELCNVLLSLKGEASSIALAEEIISAYTKFSAEEKTEFFQYLETGIGTDLNTIELAISEFLANRTQDAVQAVHKASESPRLELFRALNMASMGTQALISMRADIINALPSNPGLSVVENDLLDLFRSWFNRGFLEIRRIDWETPAVVLEKLIEYESVHEIMGWPDLRRRLEDDRRCFGFFHPVMPYEPLIFVEVALTNEISSNVSDLIKQEVNKNKNSSYNTAIFYSINNCLKGLRGVSFGNLLIKQVVEQLERENSSIKTYSTLSPLPKFSSWLKTELANINFLGTESKDRIAALLEKPVADQLENSELKKDLLGLCAFLK